MKEKYTVMHPSGKWLTMRPRCVLKREGQIETKGKTLDEILEEIFVAEQNDFNPKPAPSASMGDIIHFREKKYRIEAIGFTEVI